MTILIGELRACFLSTYELFTIFQFKYSFLASLCSTGIFFINISGSLRNPWKMVLHCSADSSSPSRSHSHFEHVGQWKLQRFFTATSNEGGINPVRSSVRFNRCEASSRRCLTSAPKRLSGLITAPFTAGIVGLSSLPFCKASRQRAAG